MPEPALKPFTPSGPAVTMDETKETFLASIQPQNQELDSWRELGPTISKSLRYVKTRPQEAYAVNRPGLKVKWAELKATLETLHELLPELDSNPKLFGEKFKWVPIKGGIKYSAYYEPTMRASRKKKGPYTQAIYARPPDLSAYLKRHGRYHSRKMIDGPKQVLAGRNLELAWADPIDVYFLHIQGHGKLVFDDGTTAYLNYAGQNRHDYRASGRLIRKHGFKLYSGDINEQKQWFRDHPEEMYNIFFDNPSYVFFRYSTRGAVGAINQSVDDYLSLAVDRTYLPMGGIIAYAVNSPDPKFGTFPLRGIGFAQDTGGAIKRDRIDIYAGSGERAEYIASNLDAKGPAWLLLRK